MPPSRTSTWANPDLQTAAALALCFCLAYSLFAHGHFSSSDERGILTTAQAVWTEGDIAIPAGKHTLRGRDGRSYSIFAPGQALLTLPFVGAGRLLDASLSDSWRRRLAGPTTSLGPPTVEEWVACLYAPLLSGLMIGLFYLFERSLAASPGASLTAAMVLGATTYVAGLSVFYLRHVTEAILILGALFSFHRFRRGSGEALLALGSLLACFAVFVRVPAAMAGPGLALYLAWAVYERCIRAGSASLLRVVPAVLVPAIAVGALHIGVNYYKWGEWFGTPITGQALSSPLLVGLWGYLLSPGISLFAYSPVLILLPWWAPRLWREHRPECVGVAAIVATFLLIVSKYEWWTGLWSAPGPRYLYFATPLLLLPLAPWLDSRPSARIRKLMWGLCGVGVLVQAGMLLVHWGSVIVRMGYPDWYPLMEFVFVPRLSPIVGFWQLLLEGNVDNWLWWMARGFEDVEGRPGAALALLAGGLLALALAAEWLRRSALRAETAHGQGH